MLSGGAKAPGGERRRGSTPLFSRRPFALFTPHTHLDLSTSSSNNLSISPRLGES